MCQHGATLAPRGSRGRVCGRQAKDGRRKQTEKGKVRLVDSHLLFVFFFGEISNCQRCFGM